MLLSSYYSSLLLYDYVLPDSWLAAWDEEQQDSTSFVVLLYRRLVCEICFCLLFCNDKFKPQSYMMKTAEKFCDSRQNNKST